MDVTLACQDTAISAHIALLAPFLSSFGITFHCIEDVPDVLILADLKSEQIQRALKSLYAGHTILPFQVILNSHKIAPKIEALEADDFEKEKSSDHASGQHNDKCGPPRYFSPKEDAECRNVKEENDPVNNSVHDQEEDEEVTNDYETKEKDTIKGKVRRPKISTTKNSFECQRCEETFKSRNELLDHKQNVHAPKTKASKLDASKDKSCPHCGKIVKNMNAHLALNHRRELLSSHPEIHLTTPCNECDEMFVGPCDLEKHTLNLHGKSTKDWPCNECDQSFATCSQRKVHKRKVHGQGQGQLVKCPYCEKAFKDAYLKSHIFNAHKHKRHLHPDIEVQYTCNDCDKGFHDSKSMYNHKILVHNGPSKCKVCFQLCKNGAILKRHMEKHVNKGSFLCNLCSREFTAKQYLKLHIVRIHEGLKRATKFQCKECNGGKYATEETLEQHMLDDHSGLEYICSQCPTVFSTKRGRTHHESRLHGEKTVKCDQCDEMFTSESCKNEHISKRHTKEKKLICPHCGEGFHLYNSFNAHVLRHTDSRQHPCEECGKSYFLDRVLKTHMKTHTLPYKCDQCDVRKGTLSDLKNHIRKIHDGLFVSCRHGCGWETVEVG